MLQTKKTYNCKEDAKIKGWTAKLIKIKVLQKAIRKKSDQEQPYWIMLYWEDANKKLWKAEFHHILESEIRELVKEDEQ